MPPYVSTLLQKAILSIGQKCVSAYKNGFGKIWKTPGQFLVPEIASKWVYWLIRINIIWVLHKLMKQGCCMVFNLSFLENSIPGSFLIITTVFCIADMLVVTCYLQLVITSTNTLKGMNYKKNLPQKF